MPFSLARAQYTDQAAAGVGVKMLIFGPPGSGKTRLLATLPNPFIISAEKGLLSLRGMRLPFATVSTVPELTDIMAWIKGSQEARRFASFGWDSISEIAEIDLKFQKGNTKDGRKAYGEMQEAMTSVIKEIRDIQGPNMCLLAKQERIKTEGGNSQIFGPMFPGNNLSQNTPYDVDECFQLVPGKTPEGKPFSALRTRATDMADVVKDRSGVLSEWEMPDVGSDLPHLGKIIQKIVGAR